MAGQPVAMAAGGEARCVGLDFPPARPFRRSLLLRKNTIDGSILVCREASQSIQVKQLIIDLKI